MFNKRSVLLLNATYQALNICTVRRAFVLLLVDKAEMIHVDEGNPIKTPFKNYDRPLVIRLKNYIKTPYRKVNPTRENIFRRDGNICGYCDNTRNLTLDHVFPKSRGGGSGWNNLVACCWDCNNTKDNKTPEEAGMILKHTLYTPNIITHLRAFPKKVPNEWKPYLYMN